jgi:hypothetical protein
MKRIWLPALGLILGALAGFIYWKMIGCNSGTCSITSKPFNSMLYFGVMGMLLFSMFQKKEKV